MVYHLNKQHYDMRAFFKETRPPYVVKNHECAPVVSHTTWFEKWKTRSMILKARAHKMVRFLYVQRRARASNGFLNRILKCPIQMLKKLWPVVDAHNFAVIYFTWENAL